MERWQTTGEVCQIECERTNALAHTIHQLLQGFQGAAVRCAKRDQLAGVLGPAFTLDVSPGDEATHRVTDEHQAGVGVYASLAPPALQRGFNDAL